ncbi:hypothetical protein ACQKJ1_23695 [Methylorubrum rhodesianum]|uniref:hypothetical protein n=1 Tax=Methylorubrum rhodesianum TaxID=29427 RepID=UPI003D01A582
MTEPQHKAPPAGLAGTVDHLDAGGGWILVRLMTRQAIRREGEHIDHCLADRNYDHRAGEEDLTGSALWSLRDPDGVSWVTLEVFAFDAEATTVASVSMAKGPGNRTVRRSVARRLQALVLAFRAAGRELDFSGETDLVMADDGRVMREDRAPEEVREQARERHITRVIRPWYPTPEADASLPVRAVTLDDYVRHIQRWNPLAFAMGLDRQAVRDGESPPQERTFAMAVRMLRGGPGGSPGGGGGQAAA